MRFPTCRIVVSYDWSSTRYFLPDHLNSTNVLTDASGTLIQVLDYYPYGSTRISQTTGGFNEQKQYIGQYEDPETNLNYLQQRYYDATKGEFLSEDPVFLGDPKQQVLTDPQSLNSYSYGNDNPITKSDPTRRCIICAGLEVGYSLFAQRAYDYFAGPSTPAVYGGDVVGASFYGYAYPYAAAFPEPVAAVSAAAGNAAQQGFEFLSGDRTSLDISQMQSAGTAAVVTQFAVANVPIPMLSSSPLSKQISTKLQKGLISNVSNSTLTKIGVSNGPSSVVRNFAGNFVQAGLNRVMPGQTYQGFASSVSMSSPLSSTISLARAAIQLAQLVIAAYKSK